MRASLAIALAALGLAACADSAINTGLACHDDATCDPSDLCVSGQCAAEASGLSGRVTGSVTATPASQSLSAAVGDALQAAVTLQDQEGIAHQLVLSCDNGAVASPASTHLAASATQAVQISIPARAASGTTTLTCAVTSTSGETTWASFSISVSATGGAGGGSGDGSAGGAGGGAGGGSAGGSAGGSGGGSAGGSAGGAGGGSAGGSGGGHAGGSGGGAAGGAGGGRAGGSGGGSAGGAGGGSAGGRAGGSGGGAAGGSGGGSAGGSGGSVGITGGTVDHLFFAVIGDSRPANIDDTANYPSAIVNKIYADIQAMSPRPQFVVSTGDYMYAQATGSKVVSGSAQAQVSDYVTARSAYSGVLFPAMGNHEYDGFTADNCVPPPHTPPSGCTAQTNCACNTPNYTAFANDLLKPIGQTLPYYSIPFKATDNSWTAKMVVVACNAWDSTQSSWLTAAMAAPTTYTFLVLHENGEASPAGPCSSEVNTLLKTATYNLAITGHVHEPCLGQSSCYSANAKEVIVGNGGAPLAYSGINYGYVTVEEVSGAFSVKVYDYSTALPVSTATLQ